MRFSPAILFSLLSSIASNSFLCTQWAEAHSRRPVTHSAGSENMLVHTWTHALNSQPTCAETFQWQSESTASTQKSFQRWFQHFRDTQYKV